MAHEMVEGDGQGVPKPPPDDWARLDNLDIPADEDFPRAAPDARNAEHQPRPGIDDLFK